MKPTLSICFIVAGIVAIGQPAASRFNGLGVAETVKHTLYSLGRARHSISPYYLFWDSAPARTKNIADLPPVGFYLSRHTVQKASLLFYRKQ